MATPSEPATPRTRARAVALTKQQQQLIKHTSAAALPVSLNRQAVLSEDEYLEALERIIARDFFPMLSERYERYDAQQARAQSESRVGGTPSTSRGQSSTRRDVETAFRRGLSSKDPDVVEQSVRRVQDWMDTEGEAETPRWKARAQSNASDRKRTLEEQERLRMSAETPRTAMGGTFDETPLVRDDEGHDDAESAVQAPRYNPALSLDDFQAQYTSEDNASFATIVAADNAARRQKYSWAYAAEDKANDKARRAHAARQKLVELARRVAEGDGEVRMIEGLGAGRPGERLLIEGRTSLPGDKESLEFAKRRLLAAPPKESALLIEGGKNEERTDATDTPAQTKAEREAELQLAARPPEASASAGAQPDEVTQTRAEVGNVQGWPLTARNNFMFPPDANIPIHEVATHQLTRSNVMHPASTGRASGSGSAASPVDGMGITEPKGIRYANTRLFSQGELENAARKAGIAVPSSPSHSNIAAAINGTPYPGRSDGSWTPKVQGYSFVDAMPSPTASVLGESGLKSLMTFGTLASTPIALREPGTPSEAGSLAHSTSSSAPSTQMTRAADAALTQGAFRIPDTPRRETIAHKMAGKATRSLQQRQGLSLSSSGLGLRRAAAASSGTPASVARVADDRIGRDTFLSPAARTLLGKTSRSSRAASEASPFAASPGASSKTSGSKRSAAALTSQQDRERERMAMDKFKRQKWDASPLRTAS